MSEAEEVDNLPAHNWVLTYICDRCDVERPTELCIRCDQTFCRDCFKGHKDQDGDLCQ